MRWLCLHGMGTNSKIFEMQTAAIRYTLGPQHTYEFVDGTVAAEMAPGLEVLLPPSDNQSSTTVPKMQYLQYADESCPQTLAKALLDLDRLVEEEGPFDGVMAFSQGAGLAASLIVYRSQHDLPPPFRCAVFFSGGVPEDPSCVDSIDLDLTLDGLHEGGQHFQDRQHEGRGEQEERDHHVHRRLLSPEQDGEVIKGIATAHIWGANDTLYPTFGPVLSKLCEAGLREEFVFEGGHEIPGVKDPKAVKGASRAILRVLEMASETD